MIAHRIAADLAAEKRRLEEKMEKPRRVQLSRRKGWKMPPNTVNVARPTKWGNVYRIGDEHPYNPSLKIDAEMAVDLYRLAITPIAILDARPFAKLRGKNLACWCALDQPCHADVLLELANVEEAG